MAAKFKTQTDVNREIERLIDLALRAEDRRDRSTYESSAYWKHHDKAVEYHEKARRLMPR